MRLTFSGDPRPAPRPRVTQRGTHYPAWYEAQAATWQLEAASQLNTRGLAAFDSGERLAVRLWFRRATHQRADFDNLCKAVTDALNTIAYADDAQIDEAHVYIARGVGRAAAGACIEVAPVTRREFIPLAADWVGA